MGRGCAAGQLDAGCECFEHTGGARRAGASGADVAIATVWDGGAGYACAVPLWCQSARALAAIIQRAELLIVSPKPSADCAEAAHVWPTRTPDAARAWLRQLRGRMGHNSGQSRGAFAVSNLIKIALFSLETQYRLVLYADLDIDLAIRPPTHAAWTSSTRALLASRAHFVGLFDHSTPVNGGLWLVRPTCQMFDQAASLLESGRWSKQRGFDYIGSPREVSAANRSRTRELVERLAAGAGCCGVFCGCYFCGSRRRRRPLIAAPLRTRAPGSGASLFKVEGTINSTQYYASNSWDFVNGALDQGLLWYLFYLKNPVITT